MNITNQDIDSICDLIFDLCGIYLDESKSYLIESRLGDLVQESGCKNYSEFARNARYGDDMSLRANIIDAITTNETLFFRDHSPFQALQYKLLPELFDLKDKTLYPKRIRIWSAASSTGQEAYSLAIVLNELIPDIHDWDISIFATDISDKAIEIASRGVYHDLEIQRGMENRLLNKYFTKKDNNSWKVNDELRGLICFQHMNLLKPFSVHGPFDIVLCRNVAIYFTPEVREDLFKRISQVLTPEGHLIVGCSESLLDLGVEYAPQQHCGAMVYQPNLVTSIA